MGSTVCHRAAHGITRGLATLHHAGIRSMLLIVYYYNSLSPEELQADMMRMYSGHFVIGRDLDVY